MTPLPLSSCVAFDGTEHLFSTIRLVSAALVEGILAMVQLRLSEEEADSLLGWLARRLGRPKALAAGDEALGRLRHVLEHWMTDGERTQLLAWLSRRVALGESPLPRRLPPREPQSAGVPAASMLGRPGRGCHPESL